MNLDRFSQGRGDPQTIPPAVICPACMGEIYPGEDVLELADGTLIHDEKQCLITYLDARKVVA